MMNQPWADIGARRVRGDASGIVIRWRHLVQLLVVAMTVAVATPPVTAQINTLGPITNWVPILWGDPDPSADQQTGSSEADIVGTTTQASFYSLFYDGGTPSLSDDLWGFRLRLAAEKNPPGYSHVAFVGLDADLDGRLDLFLGVNNQGSSSHLGIWLPTPGTNLNVSPNTLSINSTPLFSYTQSVSNYSWLVVDANLDPVGPNYNIDGASGSGEQDRMLTFVLPFNDVVTAMATAGITNFSANTAIHYVVGTSTQINSINQDLNGVDGGINSSATWDALNAFSQLYTVNGIAVPEPQLPGLIGLAAAAWLLRHRPQKRRD
jgi:hypothetical protein